MAFILHSQKYNLFKRTVQYFVGILLITLAISLLTIFFNSKITNATSATDFNAGTIISDSIFTNNSSMNVSQIQAFLNSKVSSCDTSGAQEATDFGSTLTHAQYAASRGWAAPPYTCLKDYTENGLSSAQIIYNIAQQYNINPQVLIVLLQKEEGLVTDTWPLSSQYRTATGYGCPDTSGCDSTYYGFTNQLTWSAIMFHSIMDQSPNWYSPYTIGINSILWNPSSSCGSSSVTITNLATAALYDYTPYRPDQAALNAGYGTGDSCSSYGNRNFFLYFSDWFGSTYSPEPVGAEIYDQQSTGKVYLVTNGVRYYVPSWDLLANYGLTGDGIVTVDDTTIQNLTDGGTLSNLIWDSSGVYLVNSGTRYHISANMCTTWNLACTDSTVTKGLGSLFQTSGLTQGGELSNLMSYNGIVYEINQGQEDPIANSQTLINLGLQNTSILSASNVNAQMPLGPFLNTTPGVVTFNSITYYFDGTTYYRVLNPTQYNDWNLSVINRINPQASSYDTSAPTSVNLSSWVKSGASLYVIDEGKKLLIPSSLSSLWQPSQYADISTQPASLLNSLPQSTLNTTVQSGTQVLVLDGTSSTQRHVPTYADYVGLNLTPATTSSLLPDKLTMVPIGNDIFAEGKIIALQDGTGRAFVVNNNKLTYIPDVNIYGSYGFSWTNVSSYPNSILTSYPIDGETLGNSIDQAGNVYIASKGLLYEVLNSNTADYGVKNTSLITIDSSIIANKNMQPLPRFIENSDNGQVYYASGGAIHYIASYSTYVAYGGLKSPLALVNTATISQFTVGQTIN